MPETIEPTAEKMEFQTEVKQLLNLVINSLYSNKEIFLRELVSNSADAIDKVRFESISAPELLGEDKDFRIRITLDEKAGTIVVDDNGIGMNRKDLIENLGTIARSGTKNFMEKIGEGKTEDINLIGQFGVGFYSAFMAADSVVVETHKAGEDSAWRWSSEGAGEFLLEEGDRTERGTSVTLHVKEDAKEFLSGWKTRGIIQKYSEFVSHPIFMVEKKTKTEKGKDGAKDKVVDDTSEEKLNDQMALWRKPKSKISNEQYTEFYKHIASAQDEPLQWSHNRVEGVQEFTTLLYLPSKAPFGINQTDAGHGLKLYVKRVFIMDDCKELLPNWLRFMKGVVDSEDLPLNVSRELLQSNKSIDIIRKNVTKKSLDMLKDLAEKDQPKYIEFWKEMGAVLKEGFCMNFENLDELKELARFQSTEGAGKDDLSSLKDYVSRMKDEQKDIYFILGENRSALETSPHLEIFREKGIEVLFLTDPIDEWVVQSLTEYDGKSLKNVAKGDLDLGELSKEEKKVEKEAQKQYKDFCEFAQKSLEKEVSTVRISTRLKGSPSCLVRGESDMDAQMERIMKMTNQSFESSKRILELNPEHAISRHVLDMYEKDATNASLKSWVSFLHGQAMLAEGGELSRPGDFVKVMNELVSLGLN